MKKSLFALMLLSILLCHVQPSFADEKNTFRTGIVTWPGNGIFYLAKEKGFFGDLNVEIKIIDDINALNNAYRSGALDAMGNSLDGTVFQFGNGSKGKIALIIDESRGGDGMIAANNIKSVKDLKGKKVAFTRGTSPHFLLNHILNDNGMTLKDIESVGFDDSSMAAQALFSGKVSAAVTWEPFLSQGKKTGLGYVIASTNTYKHLIPNIHSITDKALKEKPEAVDKFIKGVTLAIDYVHKNPDASVPIIARGLKMKEQEVKEGLATMIFVTLQVNQQYLCADKPKAAEVFDEAASFWYSEKLIGSKPENVKDYISTIGCKYFVQQK